MQKGNHLRHIEEDWDTLGEFMYRDQMYKLKRQKMYSSKGVYKPLPIIALFSAINLQEVMVILDGGYGVYIAWKIVAFIKNEEQFDGEACSFMDGVTCSIKAKLRLFHSNSLNPQYDYYPNILLIEAINTN
jgi:hypothetical protein